MQGDAAEQMSAAQSEVKKLNEQVSQLRQENITLKVNPFISGRQECKKSFVLCLMNKSRYKLLRKVLYGENESRLLRH